MNIPITAGRKILEKPLRHFTLLFTGYSMYPFLKPGDLLVVREISSNSLRIGDIVLASDAKKRYMVHRLVKILSPNKGVLKGDSMLKPDPEPVELSTLTGKVIGFIRGKQLVILSTGLRSGLNKLYAFFSLKGLTPGAIRLRIRNTLISLFRFDGSNAHNKEWRFIIATLSNRSYRWAQNLDWMRLRQIARKEGVTGILYKLLREGDIPESVLESFRNDYQSITARNIINLSALEKLEDALSGENIQVMALKGASLLNNVYHDIGMRPMGDIDLMVRPAEQERFVNISKKLGYRVDPPLSHFLRKDKIIIDLHIHALNTDRITNRKELFPGGMDPVWDNSVPWAEGYRWLRRPDDVDNILLLSQHFMKHSFSRLIWLMDIFRLTENTDFQCRTDLSNRADYLQQRKSLSYSLYLMDRIFYHKSAMLGLSRLERGILEAKVSGKSTALTGPLMAMFCIHGFRKKFAFGWESLFPKKDIMKQEGIGVFGRLWSVFSSLMRRF
jgi:hypothetical protein